MGKFEPYELKYLVKSWRVEIACCSESQIDLFLILIIFMSLTYESRAKKIMH